MGVDIVTLFKRRVQALLKSPETRFILFGSRARGNAEEFSDYDILIITPQPEGEYKETIEDIESEIFFEYNAIINSHLLSEAEIRKLSFEPFIINALKEGIAA